MQALIFESLEYFRDLELFMLSFMKIRTILETRNCSCSHFWKQGQFKTLKLSKIPFLKEWRILDSHTKNLYPYNPNCFYKLLLIATPTIPTTQTTFSKILLQTTPTTFSKPFLQILQTAPSTFSKPPQQPQPLLQTTPTIPNLFPKAPRLLKLFKN